MEGQDQMSKWLLMNKKADFRALARANGIDQVTARIMINRGVLEEDFDAYLHPSLDQIRDPHDLKDVDRAADLLSEAIDEGKRIRIIGDYDIDGIQSVYILHQAFLTCGAKADYILPNRVEDGYGLNPHLVENAYEAGVSLMITCDNGIAAQEAIAHARDRGMTVIVTDHHEVPFIMVEGKRVEKLPPADAIVNPKQAGCSYPFDGICGAVVAWKLVFVLYEKRGVSVTSALDFLENAAFATIGDVMPLVDENRAIVALGLERLRRTCNPGMAALMRAREIDPEHLSTYHVGFILGPCLNAAGRLETAVLSTQLLEERDQERAEALAEELAALNETRKEMTQKGLEAAFAQIEERGYANDPVLVIYLPKLHESIAGLVAGKVKERLEHPCFVLTDTGEEGVVKGSGRSIPPYSMFEEMSRCKDLMIRFGGHPMAAGLSLQRDKIDALRKALNANCRLTSDDLIAKIHIDVPMPLHYISISLVEELKRLEPFGNGNPKPLFAVRDVSVRSLRAIGREGQFLKFLLRAGPSEIDGIYFGDVKAFATEVEEVYGQGSWEEFCDGFRRDLVIRMVYEPQINFYHGRKSLQLVIREIEPDSGSQGS